MDQHAKYDQFYGRWRRLRWAFRADVRYRCRRLHDLLEQLGIQTRGARVLDVGFGGGHLLASFPRDCRLVGADIARSAVEAASEDSMFANHSDVRFVCVEEDRPETLPEGPFDIVLSSHTLEHVPDDTGLLLAVRRRLVDGGVLVVFVPIEEPDYIDFHRRAYSMQSICELIERTGFELLHREGSMQVNGHIWKLLTIPSRRGWPVAGRLADALRLVTLSAHTYRGIRIADQALHRFGFGPRQALVVAQRARARGAAGIAGENSTAGPVASRGHLSARPAASRASLGTVLAMQERARYAPFLAQLVVTRFCNLACGYCSEFDKLSKPIPTEELEARMDKLAQLGTFAVELTGGEPMTHPDIAQLVAYARRSKKFLRVQLISNGFLLNADKIRALNDAGLQEMQISVDGVRPNDITIKVLEPLRKKLEVVAREARFKVVINSVVGSAPGDEVLEVIDFARDLGFVPRVSFVHGHDGQLSLDARGFALIGEIRKRLGRRFFNGGDYRQRLLVNGEAPYKCRAGSRYLYIDELGAVRWCSQTREAWGMPLLEYTREDLRTQFHMPKKCNTRCTLGCVRHCSRYDRWRAQGARWPA